MSTPQIVLHQPGRGPRAPSFSPFALKLETFMRMAKINYTNHMGLKASSKGKVPWMTFNGEVIADSEFCVEFLNRKLNIDLNRQLTPDQKAVARAFRKLAEEDLFWCMVVSRVRMVSWIVKMIKYPRILVPFARRKFTNQTLAQGMGRHSHSEMVHIMEGNLQALSDYLGTKRYFFGEEPCETDCALFGQIAQIYWQLPNSEGEQLIRERFTNLCEYCERMKTTFWPDWDECITREGTVKAKK